MFVISYQNLSLLTILSYFVLLDRRKEIIQEIHCRKNDEIIDAEAQKN
jgi:hypothetical protein